MKYAMLQIKKDTHTLLKKYCEDHGFKLGNLVDILIKKHITNTKNHPTYSDKTRN